MLRLLTHLAGDRCLTTDMLIAAMDQPGPDTMEVIKKALIAQAIERDDDGGCFRLTAEGRAVLAGAPVKPAIQTQIVIPDTRRQRIWTAMRAQGKFTVATLMADALQPGEREKALQSSIGGYINALAKAGYLTKLDRRALAANGQCRWIRWRLVNDTGYLAPAMTVQRFKQLGYAIIHDRNTDDQIPVRYASAQKKRAS